MKVPAVCGNCGLVFPSLIEVHASARLLAVTSECPNCQSEAKVIDGYFALVNGLLELIEGPNFSREILALMYEAAQYTRKHPENRREAVAAVAQRSPEAAMALQGWISIGIQFAVLMISIAALVMEAKDNRDNRPSIEIAIENSNALLGNYIEQIEINEVKDCRMEISPPSVSQSIAADPPDHEVGKNRKQRRAETAIQRRKKLKR